MTTKSSFQSDSSNKKENSDDKIDFDETRIDYELVKECTGADSRIGYSHFEIFCDGYRGYAGACLPKDTKAFIQFAEKMGIEPKLFKTLEEINEELINKGKHGKP